MTHSHTPLPYEVSAGDIWPVNGNPRVKIATITKPAPMNAIDWQANAAFIVKACNSHYELLEALKSLYQVIGKMPADMKTEGWGYVVASMCGAKEAIAKATGDENV